MKFAWDEKKNQSNIVKHDVDFEMASEVFRDPFYLSMVDEFSTSEERLQALGVTQDIVLLLVVHTHHTDDGEEMIRIISAQRATKHERRIYEKTKR